MNRTTAGVFTVTNTSFRGSGGKSNTDKGRKQRTKEIKKKSVLSDVTERRCKTTYSHLLAGPRWNKAAGRLIENRNRE